MSNYKYVPANLTVDTFIDRVRAGEVFYIHKCKVIYDSLCSNPFRVGSSPLEKQWGWVPELTSRVETTWKDEVSEENPLLCWVGDLRNGKSGVAVLIFSINHDDSYPYKATQGTVWKHATPVLPTECWAAKEGDK